MPPDADGDVRSVLRTPWARRWATVVLLLMLAWTAVAWELNERHFRERMEGAVEAATAQARARQVLVEDGLRNGLAQLDGVAHMLTRLPSVRHAVTAAGPAPRRRRNRAGTARRLQAQPELAP